MEVLAEPTLVPGDAECSKLKSDESIPESAKETMEVPAEPTLVPGDAECSELKSDESIPESAKETMEVPAEPTLVPGDAECSKLKFDESIPESANEVGKCYRRVYYFKHELLMKEMAKAKNGEIGEFEKSEILVSTKFKGEIQRLKRFYIELAKLICVREHNIRHLVENEDYLDLKLISDVGETEVRILCKNLYVIGFRKQGSWYELRKESDTDQKIFPSIPMGYGGNYTELQGQKVKNLDIDAFKKAVQFICHTVEPTKWKISVATVVKCISETLRFSRVYTHMFRRTNYMGYTGKDVWNLFEQQWQRMSVIVWRYIHDRQWNPNTVCVGVPFRNFDEIRREIYVIMPEEACDGRNVVDV